MIKRRDNVIETTRSDLDALLRRVDLLILNDSKAREMTWLRSRRGHPK
jgi:hypothetical protein